VEKYDPISDEWSAVEPMSIHSLLGQRGDYCYITGA